MSDVVIEIRSCASGVDQHWRDLVTRAPGNVFMDPAALNTVDAMHFAKLHVLLAWACGRLVGVWALCKTRLSPLGPTVLTAPPYEYCFLSNPVVDPAFVDTVIPAFFAALQRHPRLPKVVRVRYLDGESPTSHALLRTLSRSAQMRTLAEHARPFAYNDRSPSRVKSSHKTLRNYWNRLCALGPVDLLNDRDPRAVHDAFETFLAMELASWKGARGTALLCKRADAAFARQLIARLGADSNASVALLRVDGRPIAAQVLLYCGTTAYTWKIAFDATYWKYSPGKLLVDRLTASLFSNGIEAIESCSAEGGFLGEMWRGRRATVDVLANVGRRSSLAFAAASMREGAYAELKRLRHRLRSVHWPIVPKRMVGASR